MKIDGDFKFLFLGKSSKIEMIICCEHIVYLCTFQIQPLITNL